MNEKYVCNLEVAMNIFDVIASSYYEICRMNPEQELLNYNKERGDYFASQIRHYIGEYAIGYEECAQVIDFLIKEFKLNSFTYSDHYTIIITIDSCLSDIDLYSSDVYSGVYSTSLGMNLNFEETNVFIYPIFKNNILNSINLELKKETGNYFRKNREISKIELSNIILCENRVLKDYIIEFKTISYNKEFKNVLEKKHELTCAVIPYTSKDLSTWKKIHKEEKVFYLSDLENKEYDEAYFSYIKEILKSNYEFVILPEMILTKDIVNQLSDTIRSVQLEKACIIIAGTLSNHKHNHCYVFDHLGNLLIKQHKQSPFDYDGKKECLLSDKTIKILDVIGIGRIAFFICKDMVNMDLNYIVGLLKIDFIIVPAFSPSLDLKSTSEQMAREFNLIVIMANCCSAITQKKKGEMKKIGYVCAPAIELGAREYHTQFYKGLCRTDCSFCIPRIMVLRDDELLTIGNKLTCSISLRNCSTICYNKAGKCI